MTDVNQWITEHQQSQSQDATATAQPQPQQPEVPPQQQQYYYSPQQQQMVMGRSPQWDPAEIEKVKVWVQFGALAIALLMIGALGGATYTRANLAIEIQKYGITQQQR